MKILKFIVKMFRSWFPPKSFLVLNFTHNDLDGVGCAIAIKRHFHLDKQDWETWDNGKLVLPLVHTKFITYGKDNAVDKKIRETLSWYPKNWEIFIAITDITPDTIELCREIGKDELLIVDHHVSRKDMMDELKEEGFNVIFDPERSATELTCEHFGNKDLLFSKYVNDHDLWKHQYPESKKINALVFLDGGVKKFFKKYWRCPMSILRDRKLLKKYEDEEIYKAAYIKQKVAVAQKSDYGLYTYANKFISDLGQELAKLSETEMGIIISSKHINFRGRGNADCAAFAKSLGGGGHKYAAGCPRTKETLKTVKRRAVKC